MWRPLAHPRASARICLYLRKISCSLHRTPHSAARVPRPCASARTPCTGTNRRRPTIILAMQPSRVSSAVARTLCTRTACRHLRARADMPHQGKPEPHTPIRAAASPPQPWPRNRVAGRQQKQEALAPTLSPHATQSRMWRNETLVRRHRLIPVNGHLQASALPVDAGDLSHPGSRPERPARRSACSDTTRPGLASGATRRR
jgi:hypothetical protein